MSIGLAEVPLNYQVFKGFGEVPLLTVIMALSLVIGIPFSAHGGGKFLKQIKEQPVVYPLSPSISPLSYTSIRMESDSTSTSWVITFFLVMNSFSVT